jgi:hypothetical protein
MVDLEMQSGERADHFYELQRTAYEHNGGGAIARELEGNWRGCNTMEKQRGRR